MLVKRSLCPSDQTWAPEQSLARTVCHREHSESRVAGSLQPAGVASGVTSDPESGPGNETGGSKAPPSALRPALKWGG